MRVRDKIGGKDKPVVSCIVLRKKVFSYEMHLVKVSFDKYHFNFVFMKYAIFFQRWFFSPSIHPIEKWSFTCDEGAVTEHLKVCPYNIRVTHPPIPKDHPIYPRVLEALEVKMKAKRESEWFIK